MLLVKLGRLGTSDRVFNNVPSNVGADFAPSRGSDEKKLPPDAGLFLAFELAVDGGTGFRD